jgi:hypothetical protein
MASSSRSDLLRMAAVVVILLAVTGVLLLFTGGSDGGGAEAVADPSVDGRLTAVDEQQLTIQPSDGSPPQRFSIRPIDVRQLDLGHLQTHMAQGLPSRVFYVEEGGMRYAVRVDDLPAP